MRRTSMRKCRIRKTRTENDQEDDHMWQFFSQEKDTYISNSLGKSLGGFKI